MRNLRTLIFNKNVYHIQYSNFIIKRENNNYFTPVIIINIALLSSLYNVLLVPTNFVGCTKYI